MSASGPKPVLASQRQDRLLHLLRTHGFLGVAETAVELQVSEMTIRRDIAVLVRRGLATRLHGGAGLPDAQGNLEIRASEPDSGVPPGSRFTIGLVVPSVQYYWPAVIAGARAAAAESGVRLILRCSRPYDTHEDRKQVEILLQTSGLDALIVAPDVESRQSPGLLRWLDTLPVPVLLAERQPPAAHLTQNLEWVASDHAAGAAMAVRHLHGLGHRRIALVIAEQTPTARHVHRGWRDQLAAFDLDVDRRLFTNLADLVAEDDSGPAAPVLAALRTAGATAVIVHPDPTAIWLQQHCGDAGLAVPGDLAIVAYDDETAALAEPPISAVQPPKDHVGRLAVQLLVARLGEGHRRPPHRVVISPVFHARGSTAPQSVSHRPPAE